MSGSRQVQVLIDEKAIAWVDNLKAVVGTCRSLRGEMNLSPSDRVPLLVGSDTGFIAEAAPFLKVLAKLSEVKIIADDAEFAAASASPLKTGATLPSA